MSKYVVILVLIFIAYASAEASEDSLNIRDLLDFDSWAATLQEIGKVFPLVDSTEQKTSYALLNLTATLKENLKELTCLLAAQIASFKSFNGGKLIFKF